MATGALPHVQHTYVYISYRYRCLHMYICMFQCMFQSLLIALQVFFYCKYFFYFLLHLKNMRKALAHMQRAENLIKHSQNKGFGNSFGDEEENEVGVHTRFDDDEEENEATRMSYEYLGSITIVSSERDPGSNKGGIRGKKFVGDDEVRYVWSDFIFETAKGKKVVAESMAKFLSENKGDLVMALRGNGTKTPWLLNQMKRYARCNQKRELANDLNRFEKYNFIVEGEVGDDFQSELRSEREKRPKKQVKSEGKPGPADIDSDTEDTPRKRLRKLHKKGEPLHANLYPSSQVRELMSETIPKRMQRESYERERKEADENQKRQTPGRPLSDEEIAVLKSDPAYDFYYRTNKKGTKPKNKAAEYDKMRWRDAGLAYNPRLRQGDPRDTDKRKKSDYEDDDIIDDEAYVKKQKRRREKGKHGYEHDGIDEDVGEKLARVRDALRTGGQGKVDHEGKTKDEVRTEEEEFAKKRAGKVQNTKDFTKFWDKKENREERRKMTPTQFYNALGRYENQTPGVELDDSDKAREIKKAAIAAGATSILIPRPKHKKDQDENWDDDDETEIKRPPKKKKTIKDDAE